MFSGQHAPSVRTSYTAQSSARVGTARHGPTPLSPSFTATTTPSALNLDMDHRIPIVTRADLRNSVSAHDVLLSSAKAYRNALIALSGASTAFANALGECARVKGATECGEHLLSASGLQYMVANSVQVLSDTLYKSFEIPLLHSYDAYIQSLATRHADYEALLSEKTSLIRKTEAENFKLGRKKNRDLTQFRQALDRLQEQVSDIEECKRAYYEETFEGESEQWGLVSSKVALLLRCTLDLSDRLASKATSDPIMESMLNEHPDPFDSFRLESEKKTDVFTTVLPPLGLNSHSAETVRGKSPVFGSPVTPEETTPRHKMRQKSSSSKATTRASSGSVATAVVQAPVSALAEKQKLTTEWVKQHGTDHADAETQSDESTPQRNKQQAQHSPAHQPLFTDDEGDQSSSLKGLISPQKEDEDVHDISNDLAKHVSQSMSPPSSRHEGVSTPPHSILANLVDTDDIHDPMAGDWDVPGYGPGLLTPINSSTIGRRTHSSNPSVGTKPDDYDQNDAASDLARSFSDDEDPRRAYIRDSGTRKWREGLIEGE